MYVTASSMANYGVRLRKHVRVVWDAGADGFELLRELLPRSLEAGDLRELADGQNVPVRMTFDLGNWGCLDVDPTGRRKSSGGTSVHRPDASATRTKAARPDKLPNTDRREK